MPRRGGIREAPLVVLLHAPLPTPLLFPFSLFSSPPLPSFPSSSLLSLLPLLSLVPPPPFSPSSPSSTPHLPFVSPPPLPRRWRGSRGAQSRMLGGEGAGRRNQSISGSCHPRGPQDASSPGVVSEARTSAFGRKLSRVKHLPEGVG